MKYFPLAVFSLVIFGLACVSAVILLMTGHREAGGFLAGLMQSESDLDLLGRTAPDFSLDLLEGEPFRLRDHVGSKVVLINFFATWCGPCKSEIPTLKQLNADYRSSKFVFVAVSTSDTDTKLTQFVKQYDLPFAVGADTKRSISDAYGVSAIPRTLLVGADGRVAFELPGALDRGAKSLRAEIDKGLQMIAQGGGVTKEDYLKNLVFDVVSDTDPAIDDPELSERAQTILEDLECPCDCKDTVNECRCETADDIREFLADDANLEGRTDQQVKDEIMRRFGED